MKNSEKYYYAAAAMLNSDFSDDIKLEVLELLLDKRGTELWSENLENKDKEAQA